MMRGFYGPGFNGLTLGSLGLAGMLIHLLFWAVVIYYAVRLLNRNGATPDVRSPRKDTALEILRERYARGEIDSEEFKRRKSELE